MFKEGTTQRRATLPKFGVQTFLERMWVKPTGWWSLLGCWGPSWSTVAEQAGNNILGHSQAGAGARVQGQGAILPAIILIIIALPSLRILYIIDEINNPSIAAWGLEHTVSVLRGPQQGEGILGTKNPSRDGEPKRCWWYWKRSRKKLGYLQWGIRKERQRLQRELRFSLSSNPHIFKMHTKYYKYDFH